MYANRKIGIQTPNLKVELMQVVLDVETDYLLDKKMAPCYSYFNVQLPEEVRKSRLALYHVSDAR